MDIKNALEIIEEQEKAFIFQHFTNEDAWKLGTIFVEEFHKRKVAAAVRIRLNSGYTVFQYGTDDTGLDHENWMTRKENTVRVKAISSIKADALLKANHITLADWFLDPMEYSTCGGCFPIRVEGVGIIGTITVSGIAVITDHEIIMDCLETYTGKKVRHLTDEF